MRKVFLHISALAAVLLLCLACSGDRATVIPRGKLAKIYADMLVTDQWAQSESHLRYTADTSLVYEPIFQKYGYDTDDYIKSVEYYMNDPERFSRILRHTTEILDKRIEHLHMLKKELRRQEEINTFVTDFNIGEFYPYLLDEPYVHYYDSLSVEADSCNVYRIVPIERADTLYDCLVMIIQTDTVVVDPVVIDTPVVETEKPREEEITKLTDGVIKEILPIKPSDAKNSLFRHAKLDTLKLKK